jgi:NAD(P)-dependent dehydrogenase (short-subunit alcohol dehydrogenase family)
VEIRDRTFIVTGASDGIGAATARALARAGARVALVARRAAMLEAIAAAITAEGGHALAAPADVTDAAAIDGVVAATVRRWGSIDGLINNAGALGPRVAIQDYPEAEFRRVLEVNTVGTFLFTRAVLTSLAQRPEAVVVNMSSYLGRNGLPDCVGYIAGKFGLEGVSRAAAAEVEGTGVAVVSVAPGMVATDMLARYLGTDDLAEHHTPEEAGRAMARMIADLGPAHNGAALELDAWYAEDTQP